MTNVTDLKPICVEFITRTRAIDLLANRQQLQRNIKPLVVDRYRRDMLNGAWDVQASAPIRIGEDGKLYDGQHRLKAFIDSGLPDFQSYVQYSLHPESMMNIDGGTPRTVKDYISMIGKTDPNAVTGIIGTIHSYCMSGYTRAPYITRSRAEAAEVLSEFAVEIEMAMKHYRRNAFSRSLPYPTMMAGIVALFLRSNQDQANMFAEKLVDGSTPGTTIQSLRDFLMREKARRATLPAKTLGAAVIKAWNAVRYKREIQRLAYSVSEEYPVIDGFVNPLKSSK